MLSDWLLLGWDFYVPTTDIVIVGTHSSLLAHRAGDKWLSRQIIKFISDVTSYDLL